MEDEPYVWPCASCWFSQSCSSWGADIRRRTGSCLGPLPAAASPGGKVPGEQARRVPRATSPDSEF